MTAETEEIEVVEENDTDGYIEPTEEFQEKFSTLVEDFKNSEEFIYDIGLSDLFDKTVGDESLEWLAALMHMVCDLTGFDENIHLESVMGRVFSNFISIVQKKTVNQTLDLLKGDDLLGRETTYFIEDIYSKKLFKDLVKLKRRIK